MFHEDPLDDWLYLLVHPPDPKQAAYVRSQMMDALGKLAQFLENPDPKRRMDDVGIGPWGWRGGTLPLDGLARAEKLYLNVFQTGGAGNTHVQEGLLSQIAATAEPSSIPFWVALLDLAKPRESFTTKRRTFALAALAYLAIKRDDPDAYAASRSVAHHDNPQVRRLAVYYLGRAYLDAKRPIPPNVLDDIETIAAHDPAFGARFHAREILRAVGLPAPLDNPGGVYAFKVNFKGYKRMYRTIEALSEQTLEDLHLAIQDALEWDNDHLYCFYVNGFEHDERYAFACPYEEQRKRWTPEAVIGELGFVRNHTFLYYFDYGDRHEFEVEVVDIRPQAERGSYPRVVASRGEAPAQYYWGEDEEE